MTQLLPLVLLVACSAAPPAESPSTPETESMSASLQPFEIQETRTHDGTSHTGMVRATVDEVEVRRLAGARAWQALAKAFLEKEDWEAALACAQQGVDELGRDYAPPSVRDDTRMKMRAVDERLEAGRPDHAALTLTGILEARVAMMGEKLSGKLAE
ncbi:MAG: hypothetical protein JRI25_08695 [Deltaproteobacteria bacterium]|nr:hypothetical protein [Deltaproteobacteria bacterium]MBW2254658.1 hypothetical protein [Deltaproteobacteria bacterium]